MGKFTTDAVMKLFTIQLMFATGILWSFSVNAQDGQNPDKLFREARIAAFENDQLDTAIQLSKQALKLAPDYTDIRVFLARLYFWSGNPEKARETFTNVLKQHPERIDARISFIDMELEHKNLQTALALANAGLKTHSTNPDLLFRKGRALHMMNQGNKAIRYYRQVLQFDPGYPHVHQLIRNIGLRKLNWQVMTQYTHDRFNSIFAPWQLGSFELLRRTSAGDIIGRINYGKRFSTTDYQLILEAYPRLSRSMYSYINMGFSDNNFFPGTRFGLSIYRAFPHGLEAELGLQYLRFDSPNLIIYTGSLSKYYRSYRISIQPFFIPDAEGNTISGIFTLHRYFTDPDNYISFRAGLGSSPNGYNSEQDINRLSSSHLEIEAQKKISHRILIKSKAGWLQGEYQSGLNRYRWTFSMAVYFRF